MAKRISSGRRRHDDVAFGVPAAPAGLSVAEIRGDAEERRGVSGLEAVPDATMVAIPDLWWAVENNLIDRTAAEGLQGNLATHCFNMGNRMAILDPPPDCRTPQKINQWWSASGARQPLRRAVLAMGRGRGAGYQRQCLPRRFVPPSGHVAGVWARTDGERGVHKAPANESLLGATELQFNVNDAEQAGLNDVGINCIRDFPGRGRKVWGRGPRPRRRSSGAT